MNALANFTPAVLNSVANENSWDTKEYNGGMQISFQLGNATVHVHYNKRFGIASAWLAIRHANPTWTHTDWYCLDGKASGKRDIVIRWLAGDFTAGKQYALQ